MTSGADDGPERSGKSAGWRSAIGRIATFGGLGTGRPENSTTGPRVTSNRAEHSSQIDESTDTGGSARRKRLGRANPQEESNTGTVTDALAKARAKSRESDEEVTENILCAVGSVILRSKPTFSTLMTNSQLYLEISSSNLGQNSQIAIEKKVASPRKSDWDCVTFAAT